MIRIPIIPGKNDDEATLTEMRKMLMSLKGDNLVKVSLLPFHRIGMAKYNKFGLPYRMNDTVPPSSQRMNDLKHFFSETGINVKIGG